MGGVCHTFTFYFLFQIRMNLFSKLAKLAGFIFLFLSSSFLFPTASSAMNNDPYQPNPNIGYLMDTEAEAQADKRKRQGKGKAVATSSSHEGHIGTGPMGNQEYYIKLSPAKLSPLSCPSDQAVPFAIQDQGQSSHQAASSAQDQGQSSHQAAPSGIQDQNQQLLEDLERVFPQGQSLKEIFDEQEELALLEKQKTQELLDAFQSVVENIDQNEQDCLDKFAEIRQKEQACLDQLAEIHQNKQDCLDKLAEIRQFGAAVQADYDRLNSLEEKRRNILQNYKIVTSAHPIPFEQARNLDADLTEVEAKIKKFKINYDSDSDNFNSNSNSDNSNPD